MLRFVFVWLGLIMYLEGTTIGQENKVDTTTSSTLPKSARKEHYNNFVWGGYLTLQIGTVTIVDVSPQAGYYFKPWLLFGGGLTYEYYNQKWYTQRISSSIYGGRLFNEVTFYISKPKRTSQRPNFSLFTHLEYEALNLDRDFSSPSTSIDRTNRFWIHGILVGGGFRQHFGKRSSFNVVILYNIMNDSRTPYDNPQLRVGFYL